MDGRPDMSLKLFRETTAWRISYFEVGRDGRLSFGGGLPARLGTAKPVTHLSPAQHLQLRELVETCALADLEHRPFVSPESVEFVVSMRLGGRTTRRRVTDEAAACLENVHKMLMDIHGAASYDLPSFRR
jgi:hypothetical protein